tara:strand:- start:189298 stop:189591 length:294 start_codon:yes stop_codon:yes gene_type:complete
LVRFAASSTLNESSPLIAAGVKLSSFAYRINSSRSMVSYRYPLWHGEQTFAFVEANRLDFNAAPISPTASVGKRMLCVEVALSRSPEDSLRPVLPYQ